jgi:hypothetical protein
MPVQKITRENVVEAAKSIVRCGHEPTLAEVRTYLGNCDSQTTLHKYLKEWKRNCLKSAINAGTDLVPPQIVQQEKRILEQALRQQRHQNEQYSDVLIKAEKELLLLKTENQGLKEENLQLQNELRNISSTKNRLEILYQEIKAERDTLYAKEMAEKNRLIEGLQEELKMVNQQAITELRSAGYEHDNAVIQEKVKIINLQEKIIKLGEENRRLLEELKQERQLYFELKLQTCQKLAKDREEADLE